MRTDIFIGFFDLFVFLGVFQGLVLSWFLIRRGFENNQSNFFQGLFLLALSLAIFEELLNNTGYIVKFLAISNYAEPTNFLFGPLVYLHLLSSFKPVKKKKIWSHFIIVILWVLYMIPYFIQSNDFKYNSYVYSKHPNWETIQATLIFTDDLLGIRKHINLLFGTHIVAYTIAGIVLIQNKISEKGESFFKVQDKKLKQARNTIFHFSVIILIFVVTKLYFGRDIGDYFIASYISFLIYLTSFQVLRQSLYFSQDNSVFDIPRIKYQKSSLTEKQKDKILEKIKSKMEAEKYFTNNLASLSGLAKLVNESQHHVSQVINEKLNQNFFELLANYRIEYSKKLLAGLKEQQLTIEEIAEQVGYNSKSSFNNAFKRITGQTPSEFRKNIKS